MTDAWTDRLSEYLDGELAEDTRMELEGHLSECATCRSVLQDLRRVTERARSLPDRSPSLDLWDGVKAGMARGPDVIDLGTRLEPMPMSGWRRRREYSLPQLAAASLVLMLFSGGAVAFALSGGQGGAVALDSAPAPIAAQVASDDGAPAGLAGGLADLEEIIRTQGDQLAPNTLRILQKNLAAIDRAIAESRAALELEPGNSYLEAHLEGSLLRREQFLRDAASIIQATD